MVNAISDLVNNISVCLDKNKFFSISYPEERVTIAQNQKSAVEIFQQIHALCEYTRHKIAARHLRQISPLERDLLSDLVNVACRSTKLFSSTFGSVAKTEANALQQEALQLKLGGRVDLNVLSGANHREFTQFVLANHLHQKMQATAQQMYVIPSLEIEGIQGPVCWTSLVQRKMPATNDRPVSIAFYSGDTLVFETDVNFKLLDDYTYLDGKIAHYNRWTDPSIRAYDHESPSPGRFKLELWTALNDKKGENIAIPVGDHSCVVLVSDTGERFGVGQMINSKGERVLEVPDSYLMTPKSSYNFKKTEFVIDKENFDTLFQAVQSRRNEVMSFSILKKNCSSFVASLLKNVGIEIDNNVHVLEILARKILPSNLVDALLSPSRKLPTVVKRAFFFLPIFYLPTVALGLVLRVLTFKLYESDPNELSLFDVIFRPWRVAADHPFSIRKWQKNHPGLIDLTSKK